MNPNYTEFKFPQIKAHPWHKIFHKRMPPEAVDLVSRLVQYSPNLRSSAVLELGILVHSVIIGVSLGASDSAETIKPLIGALSFHQFFDGMGLGSCIAQAKFKSLSVGIMATFCSLTTLVGIVVGIGISSVYDENSPTALIVQGVFDAAAAGILIYMALVDLLAADFLSPKLQSNKRIHLGANVCLLLGAGCMAVLAKWA